MRIKASMIAVVLAAAFGMGAVQARAEKLPKTAIKLTAAEAKVLYSGKSSNWDITRAYFAPDGTVSLIKKDKTLWAKGQWTVKGNEVCMTVNWHNLQDRSEGKNSDCWIWYRDGKRHLTLWSGEKDRKGGYWDGELKKMSKGDKVSKIAGALRAKW